VFPELYTVNESMCQSLGLCTPHSGVGTLEVLAMSRYWTIFSPSEHAVGITAFVSKSPAFALLFTIHATATVAIIGKLWG